MTGYRVYAWSSHKVLGKRGAAFGQEKDRVFILSMVTPFKYLPPFKTKAATEKQLLKIKRYNDKHNKMFRFRYRVIKTK